MKKNDFRTGRKNNVENMGTLAVSFTLMLLITFSGCAQTKPATSKTNNGRIITGAERFDLYAPLLKGKAVAVFANQTSMIGNKHLVDVLKSKGIKIQKIFSPEHGFRGTADAGEKVNSE